ncbi:hypothetical protein IFM89_016657 [Coptis chinensis]|uniref:Nuclear envelope integral membrane protein 1 n=1 Tax=Coptis chinensis TaxID=261450 RepID=A0A835IT61_9MAGN|nr:hypothetical protein IFM89_016657 [Coptis chinensis]
MEISERLGFSVWVFCLIASFLTAVSAVDEFSMHVGQNTTLKLSTGSRSGAMVVCKRIHIHGLSRPHNLNKFAHSVKVKVRVVDQSPRVRMPNAEVCFHRNVSLGICTCPQSQWEKFIQGSWVHSMSPYDNKLLDIRLPGPSVDNLEVLIEEEFLLYRVVFLLLGTILLAMAPRLSKSIVFYYSGAMTVGVLLVILIVLFQGMKLLPTGRKNSLAIVIYSSFVGVGSFLLRYLPHLLHLLLVEIGISDDMYTPMVSLVLVCILLAGAWLGFWVVRKFVLTEDGSIDLSVSLFVVWSIRILSAVMITQSSLDPLLAAEALLTGILVLSILGRMSKSRFLRRLRKRVFSTTKNNHRNFQMQDSPSEYLYDESGHKSQRFGEPELLGYRTKQFTSTSCNSSAIDYDSYLSTYHNTPERKNFSKEEWETFTRDSTRKALEELVSSPDFNKWAVRNAERITLAPPRNQGSEKRSRWLPWFLSS